MAEPTAPKPLYEPGVGPPAGYTITGVPWWYYSDAPKDTKRVLGRLPRLVELPPAGIPERADNGAKTAAEFAAMYARMTPNRTDRD